MQMLNFYPWELRPLLKFFLRGFFNKEPNKANLLESFDGVRRKVIFPPRPDNPVNSQFHETVDEFVK